MIVVDPAECSGCRRCEVHCSFFHSGKVSRGGARMKVVKIEGIGLDFPVVCQLCKERYCTDCPEKAVEIDALGQVKILKEACTRCGTCEALCPIGAIEIFDDVPCVCDLCGGDPQCIQACTMGALTFEPDAKEVISLEKASGDFTPEEKRIRFAQQSFNALRNSWVSARRG